MIGSSVTHIKLTNTLSLTELLNKKLTI